MVRDLPDLLRVALLFSQRLLCLSPSPLHASAARRPSSGRGNDSGEPLTPADLGVDVCAALFRGRHTAQLAALQRLLPGDSQDMRLLFFRVSVRACTIAPSLHADAAGAGVHSGGLAAVLPLAAQHACDQHARHAQSDHPLPQLLAGAHARCQTLTAASSHLQACAAARQIALAPSPAEQQRLEQEACALFFRVAAVFAPGASQAAFPGQAAAVAHCAQQLLAELSGAGGEGERAESLEVSGTEWVAVLLRAMRPNQTCWSAVLCLIGTRACRHAVTIRPSPKVLVGGCRAALLLTLMGPVLAPCAPDFCKQLALPFTGC